MSNSLGSWQICKCLAFLLLILTFSIARGRIIDPLYLNVPIDASLIRLYEESCSLVERMDTGHRLPIGVFDIARGKEVKVMVEEHSTLNGKSCSQKLEFLKARLSTIQKIYGRHAKVILSASNGQDSAGKLLPGEQWIELNVATGQAKISSDSDPRAPKPSLHTLPSSHAGEHGAQDK